MVQPFMDFENLDEPIQTIVEDTRTVPLEDDRHHSKGIYLKKNTYQTFDNIWYNEASKSGTFYSIERIDDNERIRWNANYAMISVALGSEVNEYERRVYNLLDLTGNIGGLFEILEISLLFVVGLYQSKLLQYTIVNQIRMTKHRRGQIFKVENARHDNYREDSLKSESFEEEESKNDGINRDNPPPIKTFKEDKSQNEFKPPEPIMSRTKNRHKTNLMNKRSVKLVREQDSQDPILDEDKLLIGANREVLGQSWKK